MKKKFVKGLYCLAIMMITLGTAFLVPSFVGSTSGLLHSEQASTKVEGAESMNENGDESEIYDDGFGLDESTYKSEYIDGEEYINLKEALADEKNKALLEASSVAMSSQVTVPNYNNNATSYYTIDSKQDLITVAYNILNGDRTWATRNYMLTTDIDLGGALWTPIGTTTNRFNGIFFGGNHTISNIVVYSGVSTDANSAVGFFGEISDASIQNLTIKNYRCIGDTTHSGALTGAAYGISTIANCYVLNNEGTTDNTPFAIADMGASVGVYRGGSRDGVTAHYTTASAIAATLKVNGTPSVSGYAVSYNANGGRIMQYYSQTDASNTAYQYSFYGAMMNSSMVAQTGRGFYGAVPTLRATAMAAQNGAYAIREGYRFTVGAASAANGYISTLTWREENDPVYMHYGYNKNDDGNGNIATGERITLIYLPYDTAWLSTDALGGQVFSRTGYTLTGDKYYFDSDCTSKVGVAGGYFVGDDMGITGTQYELYLKWAANTGIGYNIDYATPTNDTGFDPSNAFTSLSVYEGTTANEVTKTAGTTYKWDLGGHTASNSIIIKFTLGWGYRFVQGQSNADGMNKTATGTPNLSTAGISFNGSYDVYRRPNYSATYDGTTGEYTIVLDDVVSSGQIYLVVERIEYDVKLNGAAVNWTLSGLSNALGGTSNVYTRFAVPDAGSSLTSSVANTTLKTRVGENFTIRADRKEEGEFIANYQDVNFASNVVEALQGDKLAGINHYINYAWKIKSYVATVSEDATYAGEIVAVSKALVVKLIVEIDYSEMEDWIAAHSQITKAVAGAYVNTDTGYSAGTTGYNVFTVKLFNNKEGEEDINSTTGMVRAYLHENAYFKLDSYLITVPTNSEHTPSASTMNEEAENGYMRNCIDFDVDYKDNTASVDDNIYTIKLTPMKQQYTATYAIYIDGELAESKYTSTGDSQLITTPATWVATQHPFDTIANVNFNLTGLGEKVLVSSGIEVVKDENDYRAAIESTRAGSLTDGTYTFATSDSVIKVYFTRKSITFNLEMKAYVDGVNGESNLNTILDTAEKTLGLAYDRAGETSKKSVTAKISLDGQALEFLDGNIASIDLMYGYYRLGWYLENGSVVILTTSDTAIPTSGEHLLWVQNAREAETLATAFVAVKQKTITLSFNEGEDALVSINSPKYEEGKAITFTYYHDQEEFADLFENIKPTAFAFSSVDDFVRKIAMNKVTAWSTTAFEDGTRRFAANANFSTTVVTDVPYGETSATLQFLPIFEDYLIYTADVDNAESTGVAAASISIKLTDKISMEALDNGAVRYTVAGVSVTTPEKPGYTAIGFKFKGNNNESAVGTEFVLSEAVIETYLQQAYYYEVPSVAAFEIETIYQANEYKVFIDFVPNIENYVEGAILDTDGRYYVLATYNETVEALSSVVVTRTGYLLAGYASAVSRDVEYALKGEIDWTYPTIFLSTTDVHVKPIWALDEDDRYITINNIEDSEITFNGKNQTVATAEFKIGGVDSPNLDLLENGDRIVSQYWAKAEDAAKSVATGLSIALRNVSDSGKYVYVVNVQSQTGIYGEAYTVVSNEFNVVINPSAVNPYNYALKGYFTGTGDYIPAADTSVGVLHFTDASVIDTSIVSVTGYQFTGNNASGENIGFNVGENREVKISLAFGANELANFTGIRGNETEGYYIVASIGEIVKANLTITLSGQGFEVENMLHDILFTAASENYILSAYGINVDGTIKTGAWTQGTYSDGNITTTLKVTKNDSATDLSDNFDIVIVGSYSIVPATTVYQYEVMYLTAANGSLKNGSDYRLNSLYGSELNVITFTGITINGVAVDVDLKEENIYYLDATTKAPIFTIFGNKTASAKIAIDENYLSSLRFTVEVSGSDNISFLGYMDASANTNYEALLDAYTTQVRATTPELRETKITYYAVYTDVKAVTISGTDANQTVYISASSNYEFATPTRIGFTFHTWTEGNGVTATVEGENTTVSVVGSNPSTLTATWTLDAPTAQEAKDSITKTASEDTQSITLSEVIGRVANANNAYINYSYEWRKGSVSLGTTDSLSFAKLTTLDAGEYSLIVTATTKDGEQTETSTFNFTLVVERIQITSYVLSSQTEVYANTNFATTLSATLNIAGSDVVKTIGTNLSSSQAIYFTIAQGNVMRTVGNYTIALNVDNTIYEINANVEQSLNFEITKAPLTISGETLSKTFGQADPELVITKTVNGELVSVTFTRTAGEAVGSYPMSYLSCDNTNYEVSATDNNFVIEKLTSNLRVTLASNFGMVYNGKTVATFATRYLGEEDKTWYLIAFDSEENELARVALSLTYQDPTSNRILPVTTNLESVFDGFTFSAEGTVKNVGSYALSCSGTSSTYDGIEFTSDYEFVITKATLSVSAVSKVFDETSDFAWTSNITGTTTMTVTGLAEGDVVTISGSLAGITVGEQAISAIVVSGNDNYNTSLASHPENATVTASDVEVKLSASELTFDYGVINNTKASSAADMGALLKLAFTANGASSNALTAGYITLSGVSIGTASDYSTGSSLKVGEYDVVFTLSSANYTNANGTFTIERLTIEQILVDLSANVVTKVYDGNTNLPSLTWVIGNIVSGDEVGVTGAYSSSAIGTGIALSLNLNGADAANYIIDTSKQPTGSITSRLINLTANLNTVNFVDGYTFAPATKSIAITYTGSEEAFISELESKFATKQGYTQTGWTFADDQDVKANFATFLQNAIDSETAFEINAVWAIDELTINVVASNASLTNGDEAVTTEIKINYYDTINLTIAGNVGYRFNSYSFTGQTTGVTPPQGTTNNESLTLTNVISGGILTINMAEIQVNVIIDMSNAPTESEATATWTTKQFGLATNKDAAVVDLLATITTKDGTYDFDYFTIGDTKITNETDFMSVVSDKTKDSSITIVAHFKAAALDLTISHENASVVVKIGDEIISETEGVYKVYFNANVNITITGNEGYKFVSESHEDGEADSYASTGAGNLNASMTIGAIKNAQTITITMEEIQVTVKAEANTGALINSEIVSSWTSKTYNYSALNFAVNSVLDNMSVTAGTYTQTGWTYNAGDVTTNNLLDLVKEAKGSALTEDYTLSIVFMPVWTGVEYKVVFNPNSTSDVTGSFDNADEDGTVTLNARYGSRITMPTLKLSSEAYNYTWNTLESITDENKGTTYNPTSDTLRTVGVANDDGSYSLNLYAHYTQGNFKLTITFDGNVSKLTDSSDTEIANGDEIDVLGATDVTLIPTLVAGYEIDTAATTLGQGSFTVDSNGYITLTGITEATTLNIVTKARTYRYYINAASFETVTGANVTADNRNYVEVIFNQNLADSALNDVRITRAGYILSALVNANGDTVATYDAINGYTFVITSNEVASDVTLTAVWTAVDTYYAISFDKETVSTTYTSEIQKLITASLSADGSAIAWDAELANGDEVVEYYFAKVEEDELTKIATGAELNLRNVAQSGTYVLVFTIKDTKTGVTRTYQSTVKPVVEIKQAELGVSGDNLVSYYTGTNFYSATAEANNGSFVIGENATTDAALNRYEFVSAQGVGEGFDIRAYISMSAENRANYSNILGDDTNGHYILLSDAASVVASEVVITAKGSGYYTGAVHTVSYDLSTSVAGLNLAGFSFEIVLETKDGEIASTKTEFTVKTFNVNGGDATANFTYKVEGSYEILSTEDAYTYNITPAFLGASSSANFRLSNITVDGERVNASGVFVNHTSADGSIIFTVSGNGSNNLVLVANSDYEVKFDVTVYGLTAPYDFVGFTTQTSETEYKAMLAGLTAVASKTYSVTLSENTTAYGVVTNMKAITVSFGDKGGETETVYAVLGDEVELTAPTWNGFKFNGFNAQSGLDYADGKLSADSSLNILPATITAKWLLDKPTAENNNQTITLPASEGNGTILIANVIGSITNASEEGVITYTYTWYNEAGEALGTGSSLELAATTDNNGAYYVVITASKTGYSSVVSEHIDFNLVFTPVKLDVSTEQQGQVEYANKDFADEIMFTLTIGEGDSATVETKSLKTLLADGNIKMTVAGGDNDGVIKNVDTYTITLVANNKIYAADVYAFAIEVEAYAYEITASDVENLSKNFGAADPELKATINPLGEDVEVGFTREAGEAVNSYNLYIVDGSYSSNYALTIAEDNKYFTIESGDGKLQIEVDDITKLTKVYNKTNTTFDVKFEENKWTLYLYNEGESEAFASTTLTLNTLVAGVPVAVEGDALEIALVGAKFEIVGDNMNVDSYTITITTGANYKTTEFAGNVKFVVSAKEIVVSNITKVFDRTNTFTTDNVMFIGLETGDDITITGTFEGVNAGEQTIEAIVLGGADSTNYTLNYQSATISISKSDEEITLTVENLSYEYGAISNATDLKTLLNASVTVGDYETAVEDGYLAYTVAIAGAAYSTSHNLKVGTYTVTFTLTSDNYSKAGEITRTLTITAKALDLTGSIVTKGYDGNNNLPDDVAWILGGLIDGDRVTITGNYDNAEKGTNKTLYLQVATSADGGNYTIGETVTGTISDAIVKLVVDATTRANFVEDDENVSVKAEFFNIEYPTTDKTAVIGKLVYPTRIGYTVSGWSYYDATTSQYINITENNILDVLALAFNAESKEITIYAVWEIDKVEITLNVSNATVSNANLVGNKITVNYYDDITVTVEGTEGYKFMGASLASGSIAGQLTTTNTGKRTGGTFTLEKVRTNATVDVTIEELVITIKVDENVAQFAGDENVVLTSGNIADITVKYSVATAEVMNLISKPSVSAGTYKLTGFTTDSTTISLDSTATLKELLGNVNEDTEITFQANWEGENYTITFNANEGEITNGVESITATYGSAMTDTFALAERTGMKNTWNTSLDGTGDVYEQGDTLATVGTADVDGYTLTLYAIWANNEAVLTVIFTDGEITAVNVGDKVISSGETYTLVYSVDDVSFTITTAQGYGFTYSLTNDDDAVITQVNKTITVSNLKQDSTLTISKDALENILTINKSLSSFTASVSGNDDEFVDSPIVAKTGTTVVLTMTADAGYEFTSSSTIAVVGSGVISTSFSNGVATITWTGFNSDSALTVEPSAKLNTITLSDSSAYITNFTVNGSVVNVNGGTYVVATGTELTISVTMKYGYENSDLNFNVSGLSVVGADEVLSETLRVYTRTFTLTDFTSDFTVNVIAETREYEFSIATENHEKGTISVSGLDSENKATFGNTINMTATATSSYVFEGWYAGDEFISSSREFAFTLNEANRTVLESANPVAIVARFALAERDVTITSGEHGKLEYTVNADEENGYSGTILSGIPFVRTLKFGDKLVITTVPELGYEVDEVLFYNSTSQITGDWYDRETGIITIEIGNASALTRIEVTFKASVANVNIVAAAEINYQISYGVDFGGKVWLATSAGVKINDTTDNGFNYSYETMTGRTFYVLVEPNGGEGAYSYDLTSQDAGVIINRSRTIPNLFEIDGVRDGITIAAIFTANNLSVSINYVNENGDFVSGGSISVQLGGFVVAAGNNSSDVMVSALPDQSFTVNLYTNLSYSFSDDDGKPELSATFASADTTTQAVVEAIEEYTDELRSTTGFSQRAVLRVSNLNSNGSITITVKPKIYKIVLLSDGNQVGGAISGITYGQDLKIANSQSILPGDRDDYEFKGYYTMELGQGKMYINDLGQAVAVWEENGYKWNGVRYERSSYFNGTDTFELYAGWYYTKERITLDFIPDELKDKVDDVNILNFVTAIDQNVTLWMSGDNVFYAEAQEGKRIALRAYDFAGYTFKHWILDRGNGNIETVAGNVYEYITASGDVSITAVYEANYLLEVYNEGLEMVDAICGTTELRQDNVALTRGSFDTTKPVTIVVNANPGFTFKGWFNLKTNDWLRGTNGEIITATTYTFPELLTDELKLRAIFEGSEIGVRFDLSELVPNGSRGKVYLNGQEIVNPDDGFMARVGDTIKVEINPGYNFGVSWNGATFALGEDGLFTYRISALDLEYGEGNMGVLIVRPVANPNPISYEFELLVENRASGEIENVGTIRYQSRDLSTGSIVDGIFFGDPVRIEVTPTSYYRVGGVYIEVNGLRFDITSMYIQSQREIRLTSDMLEIYDAGVNGHIIINFTRVLWTEEYSELLSGMGTSENPFKISSIKDLAFVSYAVNNGLANANGVAYKDAYYELTADIDLAGKYWVPIGTAEHMFNGIIRLGNFQIKNIDPSPEYDQTPTYYEGLIGYKTDRAEVITSNNDLIIALSIAAGVLLLLILIIIIIVITRKKKKKKLDELANS